MRYINAMKNLIIILHFILSVHCVSKLNEPKVLLPIFNEINVNFTLSVINGGCYTWTLSRLDIISIQPIYDVNTYCSDKAVVSVVTRKFSRGNVAVVAEDVNGGTRLSADIIVDVISTLKIVSKARELYLEELPQRFIVRAQDAQGNEFTTLEGVEFQWSLMNIFSMASEPVMRIITFSDSHYSTPSTMITLEKLGKRGHIALLEGVRPGISKIEVYLKYSEYSSVSPAELQVTVLENIELQPSTAYMIPGDCLQFRLYQMRRGKRIEINNMDNKYSLLSKNYNIARVTKQQIICSKATGKVDIEVHDVHLKQQPGVQKIVLATASVVVAAPKYMTLTILPFNSWSLTTHLNATIVPEIYTENNQKFLLGNNVVILTKEPEDIFIASDDAEKNGTLSGTTFCCGSGPVIASLAMDNTYFSPNDIMAENTLYVYDTLYIKPDILVLPWSTYLTPKLAHYSLKAHGGDSKYVWSSSDTSIVETTQNGFLMFMGPGSTMVSVSMESNEKIKASATIHLLIPKEIKILDVFRETEIKNKINLHIMVYGELPDTNGTKKVLFTFCDYLDFIVTPKSIFIKSGNDSVKPYKSACVVKSLLAVDHGCENVTVGLPTNGNYLETSYLLCSYRKLEPIQPANDEIVTLAIESSYDVVFTGGPTKISGSIQPLLPKLKNIYFSAVKTFSRPDLYVFRVTCKKVGSEFLKFSLLVEQIGFESYNISSQVSISCQIPEVFEVYAKYETSCPNEPSNMIAYPLSTIRFDIKVLDNYGREFHNVTSLKCIWSFDNESITSFNGMDRVLLEEKKMPEYKTPIIHYMTVKTNNQVGDFKGTAKMYRSSFDWTPLTSTFRLSVVQRPVIEPKVLIPLLNVPNNIGYLKVKGGSGYFNFHLLTFASIRYTYDTRTIEVIPQKEGSCELFVIDQCLPDIHPLKVNIQVVSIANLQISGTLKIQQGSYGKLVIKLLDSQFKQLSFPNMSVTQSGIKIEMSSQLIADIDSLDNAIVDNNAIHVNFKGNNLGHFTAWAQLGRLSSNSINIQVFPRLQIAPTNLTLAVCSEFQITVTGGPSFDSHIQFLEGDTSIITVSDNAVVRGLKAGLTTVTVKAVSSQGDIYCKDTIDVHVIVLNGVSIIAPIAKLGVGNTMPVWAIGIPQTISPLLLGSINPSLLFEWHVSTPNIVQIQDPLHRTTIQVSSENKLSVRLYGLSAGLAHVELHVTSRSAISPSIIFNSSITIVVDNFMEWTRPNVNSKTMLMAPNSVYSLKTNSLNPQGLIYSLHDSSNDPAITVSSDGFLKSGYKFGSALVEVKQVVPPSIPQTLFLPIEIRPVHYLMINIETVLESSEDLKSLPRGLFLNLTISYHDQFGTEFFVAPFTKPSYACSICSKVQFEDLGTNHSLVTSLTSSGSVILRAYDKLNHIEMEDYIKIPVDNYIVPNKAVFTVGEVICFWTPFVAPIGRWSSNGNLIAVEPNGIATAKKSGFDSVTYTEYHPESTIVLTSTNFEILPLQSYIIEPSNHTIISNRLYSEYRIPVFLMNEKSSKDLHYYKNCNSSGILFDQFPFECEIEYSRSGRFYPLDKIFSVHEDFDYKSGSLVCVIKAIKGPLIEISKISSNITLIVSNGKEIKEEVVLNFCPHFTVLTDYLVLNQFTTKEHLTIYGTELVLKSISVETCGTEQLKFSLGFKEADNMKISFYLDKKKLSPEECIVTISSAFTEQEYQVVIQIVEEFELSKFMKVLYFIINGLLLREYWPFIVVYSILITFILVQIGYLGKRPTKRSLREEYPPSSRCTSSPHDQSLLLASPDFLRRTSGSGSSPYQRTPTRYSDE